MKLSKITLAVLAASSFAGAAHAAVAVTGTAALTSDYLFRGISQSSNGMAVQGSFTATDDSGIYFTAWGSSISAEATTKSSSAGTEIDTLLGYTTTKGDVTYDIGIMRYNYPGADKAVPNLSGTVLGRQSYNEAYASIAYKGAKLGTAFSDDYFGKTGRFNYVYADYAAPITEKIGVIAHVGWNKFANNGTNTFLGAGGDAYFDYKAGFTTSVAGVNLEAAYIGADSVAQQSYTQITKGRAVFTVSKAF